MIDVGQVIDKYELLERVGQGGMAVVYRGLDRSLRRHVAVKVLHRHLADHDEARDRFEREAHAVAKLRHENILEIFDYSGKAGGESYIVTEFIDGKTLKQAITDHPPRYAEIGAMVTVQICRALSHAHGQGVLHRDVKPENVMIRSDGVIKLTDFGISQMLDAQRMTVTGQLLGSPAYMSPEHVEGRPLDFRTDVFAVGIVLYQLTVGKLPFEGKNPHEILKRIAECRFQDPRQANPRVGNQLGKIILKAMARDPDARYPVITAMLTELEQYVDGSGLGPSKDELARYFASPGAYELALGSRLVDHLLRRARESLPTQRAVGLELLDRVLTIEPGNAAATALVAGLERTRRWRQGLAVAGLLAIAGGGAWSVRRTLTPDGGSAAGAVAADAATDATTLARAPVDAAGRALPDAAPVDAAAVLVVAAADAAATVGEPDRRPRADARPVAIEDRRRDAGPIDAAAQVRTFTLAVSPKDAEYRVGGGSWQRSTTGSEELTVTLPIEITVRKDDCCEAVTRTIGADVGRRVAIELPFLPALITARCDRDEVTGVTIDGDNARLGLPATIPFEGTITQKSIKIEFITKDRIETQTVTVKANDQREVACAP